MPKPEMNLEVLKYLDEIVDLCIGNIPADDIGAGDLSTLPEALSKVESDPSHSVIIKCLKYIEKLKLKVVFLEKALLQARLMQEHGITK